MTKAKTIRKKDERAEHPVLIFKEETFDHDGLIATRIDGVIHFIDRSYAKGVGIVEHNAHLSVEGSMPELELYGTVHVAHGLFAVVGNGAKYPVKGYWLNGEQFMILLMKSSSARAIEFRRRVVMILRDLREGRLVYRDNALVACEPGHAPQTAHAGQPTPTLPFDLSKGLAPVPEVHAWAWSFAVKDKRKIDIRDIPRTARTDDGVTLRVIGTMPCIADSDIAMLAGPEEALTVGDLVRANLALFEKHGKIWTSPKSRAGAKRGVAPDHLLNIQ